MTYKQRVKAFQKEIGFIIRNEKYYKILYADFDTKRMVIKEVDKENPKNTTEYEVLSKDWIIEINNKTITPDEYFLQNCESSDPSVKAVTDKKLISYINENKEKESCKIAVDKLIELALTYTKANVKRAAYQTCKEIGVVDEEFEKTYKKSYTKTKVDRKPKLSAHKSKYYNPSVGEFGFCCEAEKIAIIYGYVGEKRWGDYGIFAKNFTSHFPYEASLLSEEQMHNLFEKYKYENTIQKIRSQRMNRLHSELSEEVADILKSYGLRVVRADGRGTSHQVKKCRRKKDYDKGRLSGYRIIKANCGTIIAGKKFELYEADVMDFISKLQSGEIVIE